MTAAIYTITSDRTPRQYVGASRNVNSRLATHFSSDELHHVSSNRHLQAAMKRHGKENFSARLLCAFSKDCPSNVIGAFEGFFTLYTHFVDDVSLYNVRLTAGEKFVSDDSVIQNMLSLSEFLLAGIDDGTVPVLASNITTKISVKNEDEKYSVVFYEHDPIDLLESVHPYLKMLKANQISSLNADVIDNLPWQSLFNDSDFSSADNYADIQITNQMMWDDNAKSFESMTDDEKEELMMEEERNPMRSAWEIKRHTEDILKHLSDEERQRVNDIQAADAADLKRRLVTKKVSEEESEESIDAFFTRVEQGIKRLKLDALSKKMVAVGEKLDVLNKGFARLNATE